MNGFANQPCSILDTPLGIVTLLGLVPKENASEPMAVTLLGIVTSVRLEQLEKAPSPMLFTLFGTVTLVRLESEGAGKPSVRP